MSLLCCEDSYCNKERLKHHPDVEARIRHLFHYLKKMLCSYLASIKQATLEIRISTAFSVVIKNMDRKIRRDKIKFCQCL
jgi:hypothetical protein